MPNQSLQSDLDQKRCVLFVVDAMMESVVRKWTEADKLPNINWMIEEGGQLNPCSSIFPSITPAATCSIATGVYPRDHGIEGAAWFNPATNRAEYFGDDHQLIFQQGLHQYLVDFGDRMNYELLRAPLIYERLFDKGIESACINYMWFRGPHVHERSTPLGLRIAAGKLATEIAGPKFLKLGDFVHHLPEEAGEVKVPQHGIFQRYGFHDETTAACALAMARTQSLPQFTLAYFPLNDDAAHSDGVEAAASSCLENFDKFLGDFVDAIGGWDVASNQYSFLIVGDHGQSEPREDGPFVTKLDELLSDFSQAETTNGFDEQEDLLICPNMRAASIYVRQDALGLRQQVVEKLLGDQNVDQVIFDHQETDGVCVHQVKTAGRGEFCFSKATGSGGDGAATATDRYGNRWSIHGEISAVDLRFTPDGGLEEGSYPNPLERIHGAFTGTHSPIWVTARPGAEFAIEGSSTHEGGSHGSLWRDDSLAALITSANVDMSVLRVPKHPRIVDVMELCLNSLGQTSGNSVDLHQQIGT